mgnify:CR=1 FL=1
MCEGEDRPATRKARCTHVKRWLLTLTPLLTLAVTATALLGGRPAHAAVPLAGLQVTVTKSPWCGCCGDYIEILRERGVDVTVIDIEDTASAKLALGVPPTTWSCHTTEVGGYAVEGHVPLEAIERLLSERPDITGISLPGMPTGSPGMNGVKSAPFGVVAFDADGVRHFGNF